MTGDKERMINNAISYAADVSDVGNACLNAAELLEGPIKQLTNNWQGLSGSAMEEALINLKAEIQTISYSLSTLSGNMVKHAWGIYNAWPEEDTEE